MERCAVVSKPWGRSEPSTSRLSIPTLCRATCDHNSLSLFQEDLGDFFGVLSGVQITSWQATVFAFIELHKQIVAGPGP